jgi:hypothetical protein
MNFLQKFETNVLLKFIDTARRYCIVFLFMLCRAMYVDASTRLLSADKVIFSFIWFLVGEVLKSSTKLH